MGVKIIENCEQIMNSAIEECRKMIQNELAKIGDDMR